MAMLHSGKLLEALEPTIIAISFIRHLPCGVERNVEGLKEETAL